MPRPQISPSVGNATSNTTWQQLAICVALIALSLLIYGRMFWDNHEFVLYDDHLYVMNNDVVKQGLTWDTIKTVFSPYTIVAANYHPLTMVTHAADCQFFGIEGVRMHHVHTLLWHTADTVLIFLVLVRMTAAIWPSALVAALFCWHPLHVESVAWISERKDVLSAFFWFLTIWLYISYVRRPSAWRYLLVAVSMLLGLLSKPMVVTLPCVLLLLDYWPLRRMQESDEPGARRAFLRRGAKLFAEKLPLFALAILASGATLLSQNIDAAMAPLEWIPMSVRIVNVLMSYNAYIAKAIWPQTLCVPYPIDTRQLSVLQAWLGGMGILLVLVIVVLLRRRYPYWFVGWLWYLGTMVPVIGIVQVGSQSMADRYSYIPLVGVFIGLAFGLADLAAWRPRLKPVIGLGVTAWLVALAVLCYQQVGYWKDTNHLFSHTIKVTKRNHGAYVGVGTYHISHNNYPQAVTALTKAVMIGPNLGMARHDLGIALRFLNRNEEALSEFQKALKNKFKPAKMHMECAGTLIQLKRYDEAEKEFHEMLRLEPDDPLGYSGLAGIEIRRGNSEGARNWYEKGVAVAPDNLDMITGLAILDLKDGRAAQAAERFRLVLVRNPKLSWITVLLSRIYSMHPDPKLRNGAEAVRLAKSACEITKDSNAMALDTLAAAYAEVGNFKLAREKAIIAKRRALHDDDPEFAREIEARYERYLVDRPARDELRDVNLDRT